MLVDEASKDSGDGRLLSSVDSVLAPVALFRLHCIANMESVAVVDLQSASSYGIFDGLDPQRNYLSNAVQSNRSNLAHSSADCVTKDVDEF